MTEKGEAKRAWDRAYYHRKKAQREAGRLQGVKTARARNGRCRWNPFCPHPPDDSGRFRGAFCEVHELSAARELDFLEDDVDYDDLIDHLLGPQPDPADWLTVSDDALALIDQLDAQLQRQLELEEGSE